MFPVGEIYDAQYKNNDISKSLFIFYYSTMPPLFVQYCANIVTKRGLQIMINSPMCMVMMAEKFTVT